MKNTIIIIMAICGFYTCKGQSPVLDLHDNDLYFGDVSNAYYKDIEGFYNQFVGTWKFISGNTTLTIILQKKEMKLVQDGLEAYFTDDLIGEYRYVENGVEKINTLSNLLTNYENPYSYSISGGIISKYIEDKPYVCAGCQPGEVRITLFFSDPDFNVMGVTPRITFLHRIENGVEKLIGFLYYEGNFSTINGVSNQQDLSVPFGPYTLIKQE